MVANFALGLAANSATIVPDGDALGSAFSPPVLGYDGNTRQEQRRVARDNILGCYAGMEPERIFDPEAPDCRGASDNENAFWLSREYGATPRRCSYVGDDEHMAYLGRLRAEARKLVLKHWCAVEDVADALEARKTLGPDELDELRKKWFPEIEP